LHPSHVVALMIILCALLLSPLVFALVTKDTINPSVLVLATALVNAITAAGGFYFGQLKSRSPGRRAPRRPTQNDVGNTLDAN
jgi:hypothetical protein